MIVNLALLRDAETGGTGLLTNRLRAPCPSGKIGLHELLYELDRTIQANGTIAAGDKTASTTLLAFIAVAANQDKVLKGYTT